MLILRAIPFSFDILWRLVLYIPIIFFSVVVFTIALVIYGVLIEILLDGIAVIFAALVLLLVLSIIPTMIGARLGLQARGVRPRSTFGGMYWPIMGYGAFEGLAASIVLFGAGWIFLILSGLNLKDIFDLAEYGAERRLLAVIARHGELLETVFFVAFALLMAMRAALLTTYASASINEDPTGRGHTPFVCFGAAFLYMFAIVIVANVAIPGVSYAIFDVSTGFDFFREFMAIVIEVISLFFNDKPKFMTWSDLPYYLAFVALWLWTFSLQAAAGVLMFLRRREIHEVAREEAREKPIMSPEEARNLWKSRMPARHR